MIKDRYLELLRRGYKVYIGKVDDLEVYLVALNRDYYPKVLLTLDIDLEADYDGITKINVVDWLLKE